MIHIIDEKKASNGLIGSFLYSSNFVSQNQMDLLAVLENGKNLYESYKGYQVENMTWEYKNYNIFNICGLYSVMNDLQSILHDIIRLYLNEYGIKHTGFNIFSWLNHHTNINQLLKPHNHDSNLHGYINIDPLESKTIMSNFECEDLFYIENKVGLIYINQPNMNNYHRVEVNPIYIENEKLLRPRVTIAFDVNFLPHINNNGRKSMLLSGATYNVFR
jgi:hypothetical protein